MSDPGARLELRKYYRELFPIYLPVLYDFLTFNGTIPLKEVEISTRVEEEKKSFMNRGLVFVTMEDLVKYLRTGRSADTLQMGGVLPMFSLPTPPAPAQPPPQKKAKQAESVFTGKESGYFPHYRGRNRDYATRISTGYGPLMFDFDLTDGYDRTGICGCGKEKKCCDTCFVVFMESTRAVMHFLLEEIMGLTGILDVFSGSRGIHIWVTCKRAHDMSRDERTSLINRFIQIPHVHDMVSERVYQEILIPYYKLSRQLMARNPNVQDRDMVFKALFPKFDAEVTKDPCHLKKLPLVPHQTKRFMCLPMPAFNDFEAEPFLPDLNKLFPTDLTPEMMEMYVDRMRQVLLEEKDRLVIKKVL